MTVFLYHTSPFEAAMTQFDTLRPLNVGGKNYRYHSLDAASEQGVGDLSRLPKSLKVVLENLLRYQDGRTVTAVQVLAIKKWLQDGGKSEQDIAFSPARVLMQDFTGVPAVVDLAAMRDAMVKLGGDPEKINPLKPVDLVIDHSVMVDHFGNAQAFGDNVKLEFDRNAERYRFLRWGQQAFRNFRVVPPGTGICHQVNLEYLAKVVWVGDHNGDGDPVVYPDTLVGTDSHTTMVNGLSVLGWGVGGIEAEAVMLGQPLTMVLPEVIGFKLTGSLREGTTATDLVLTVTQMLRAKGVVNKFVEFYGEGLNNISLADRATISNMAPEYGATCGFFPIDQETLNYLAFTGRDSDQIKLVEAYARAQGLWFDANAPEPQFTDTLALDMGTVESCLAGPKRPQDRVLLGKVPANFAQSLADAPAKAGAKPAPIAVANSNFTLDHGHVVLAAITSCTNTSNPDVLLGAGLVAKKARQRGLTSKPWVKTSLAPGSQVVTDYLQKSGLIKELEGLGFYLVGYGCTTCIGNSGPLPEAVEEAIGAADLNVAAVLSGNRNFEARIHPLIKSNYLASPMLVVAFAIAGTMNIDLANDPLGTDSKGNPVFLRDIWPTQTEIRDAVHAFLTPDMFKSRYANVFLGDSYWQATKAPTGRTYEWDAGSTYVQNPPYFDGLTRQSATSVDDIKGARLLASFGDSITTDHISPAGNISANSPAGSYLAQHQVRELDFNSYGARRGNHEIMMRGTFANKRIKNELLGDKVGGFARHVESGEVLPIYDVAMGYQGEGVPLIVVAGKEYGTGSSRDWAAKGTRLLGIKAVLAESFERIHRSNLIGMGVLPLVFLNGLTRHDLDLTGEESFDLTGLASGLRVGMELTLSITYPNGRNRHLQVKARIDTPEEIDYFLNGGILPYVLRKLAG
jgi:aconitate hydratase